YIYKKSWSLVIREILISTFFAFLMDMLLLFLIKKITRPLQAINEAQRQLIGSMSHELKTPLTAIKGYSETLLSVKLSKEQEEKALNYINQESGRLSRLSEKMMELTRLYEPECKITMQTISIEALFENVENSVKQRLEEKGLLLVREGNYLGKKLNADSDLMTSFLLNLINNSIMASESGSHIYLGADDTSIWVRDEGSGIPKEELEKVRKAFYRVDKSRSRKSGNMGLGLALCDQIAMVHHGRMKIESEVGKGTKIIYQSFTNE
ncbi:MAG: HAMP domain-containing histidine kinase, partial [Lachnospiraceae bacterium]